MAKKQIARQLGVDPKTVRRYVRTAEQTSLDVGLGLPSLTDDRLGGVLIEVRGDGGRPRGDTWSLADDDREMIERLFRQRVSLSKSRRLLVRQGVAIPCVTLHRFAVTELDLGRSSTERRCRTLAARRPSLPKSGTLTMSREEGTWGGMTPRTTSPEDLRIDRGASAWPEGVQGGFRRLESRDSERLSTQPPWLAVRLGAR